MVGKWIRYLSTYLIFFYTGGYIWVGKGEPKDLWLFTSVILNISDFKQAVGLGWAVMEWNREVQCDMRLALPWSMIREWFRIIKPKQLIKKMASHGPLLSLILSEYPSRPKQHSLFNKTQKIICLCFLQLLLYWCYILNKNQLIFLDFQPYSSILLNLSA